MDDINDIEQKGELETFDMDTALRWPCTVCELKFISRGVLDKHMNLAHSGAVVGEVEEGTDMDIVVKACTVVGLAKESPRHEEDLFPTTSGHTHVVESEEEENNTAMEEGVRMEKPKAKKPDAKPAPKEESSSEESSSEGEKPKSAAKTVAATKEESSSVATKFPVVKTAAKKESSSEDSGSEEEEELEQSDEVNSNENVSIVESIENIKNCLGKFLDDKETEDSALETLAMPASLLCCLCNDTCCSVEDLGSHLRNTHGVKKENLGELINKTMQEQSNDQEEIDDIEIVEVSDEDEDEDEVFFVSEHEGVCMTAEEKEVFRKCFSKKNS